MHPSNQENKHYPENIHLATTSSPETSFAHVKITIIGKKEKEKKEENTQQHTKESKAKTYSIKLIGYKCITPHGELSYGL